MTFAQWESAYCATGRIEIHKNVADNFDDQYIDE